MHSLMQLLGLSSEERSVLLSEIRSLEFDSFKKEQKTRMGKRDFEAYRNAFVGMLENIQELGL
jgi:hypothetical protein